MSSLLHGVKAFVAGATGEVGKGAVVALANAGAELWIAGRNEDKLNELKDFLSPHTVHVVAADYSTAEGAKELERKIGEGDLKFDIVVASSGPWWSVDKLYKIDDLNIFDKAFKSNVQAQMLLYRVLITRTKQHYIAVNGTAAYALPDTSLTGICANAVVGFAKVAFAECSTDPVLPQFTHAIISSSVGHAQFRGKTNDPVDFGRVFIAMALGKHTVDSTGTILVNDEVYKKLASLV